MFFSHSCSPVQKVPKFHCTASHSLSPKNACTIIVIFYKYYIPYWMIVKNIIPRNVTINRGAAEVDNHISRDDIFDYHPIRECNIYFIIPNIRSFIITV